MRDVEVRPDTKYAKAPGGLVAYQVVGDGPIDLVFLSGATSSVDVRWENPAQARFLSRLSAFSRLILFDRRGAGLSDPVPVESIPTWEEWADDVRVVMDAAGSERAAIFAHLDAGPMGMLFAATKPDRTTALLLSNTGARYISADDYPMGLSRESAEVTMQLVEQGWGTEDFASMASPSLASDPEGRAWFARYMRASASPHYAAAQLRTLLDLDVRGVLPSIQVPTLVLHRHGYRFTGPELGRYVADHIPGARFVELPGEDSLLSTEGADFILDTVEEFLTGARRVPEPDRVLATLLVTDLVDSTRTAADLGDMAWKEVIDRHDGVARSEVQRYAGRLLKTTGDGILARFDAPGRAIRCSLAIRSAVQEMGLEMRAGLHTGEIDLRGDDVGGIAVHIAARVAALAGAGEVLVSSAIPPLVAGSDVEFADRGVRELKGVPGEWRLYEVR